MPATPTAATLAAGRAAYDRIVEVATAGDRVEYLTGTGERRTGRLARWRPEHRSIDVRKRDGSLVTVHATNVLRVTRPRARDGG